MGTEITMATKHDARSTLAVATTAAGSVAVADGELALFVGNAVTSQAEAWAGLQQCLQALREAGWPNPVTLELSYAHYDTAGNAIVTGNGAAPTLTETMVAILQGLDFTDGGISNSARVHAMMDAYLDSAKAA